MNTTVPRIQWTAMLSPDLTMIPNDSLLVEVNQGQSLATLSSISSLLEPLPSTLHRLIGEQQLPLLERVDAS